MVGESVGESVTGGVTVQKVKSQRHARLVSASKMVVLVLMPVQEVTDKRKFGCAVRDSRCRCYSAFFD